MTTKKPTPTWSLVEFNTRFSKWRDQSKLAMRTWRSSLPQIPLEKRAAVTRDLLTYYHRKVFPFLFPFYCREVQAVGVTLKGVTLRHLEELKHFDQFHTDQGRARYLDLLYVTTGYILTHLSFNPVREIANSEEMACHFMFLESLSTVHGFFILVEQFNTHLEESPLAIRASKHHTSLAYSYLYVSGVMYEIHRRSTAMLDHLSRGTLYSLFQEDELRDKNPLLSAYSLGRASVVFDLSADKEARAQAKNLAVKIIPKYKEMVQGPSTVHVPMGAPHPGGDTPKKKIKEALSALYKAVDL